MAQSLLQSMTLAICKLCAAGGTLIEDAVRGVAGCAVVPLLWCNNILKPQPQLFSHIEQYLDVCVCVSVCMV